MDLLRTALEATKKKKREKMWLNIFFLQNWKDGIVINLDEKDYG